ncbi:MAG: nicotinamide riboside transporter PnuC [Bacteroidales bacterium]|nr:nicotinamide riboside transporter PnuC [Bacteroidales bacterium]
MIAEQFWTYLEYFGVISGLIYLWLEIKQNSIMWIVGGISALIYIFVFAYSKVYADMAFNIYYAIISFWGYFMWRKSLSKGNDKEHEYASDSVIEYSNVTPSQALKIGLSTGLIYLIIFLVLSKYTDSPIPYGDALTTTLSIIGTWMLAKKIIQHWDIWIIVNVLSIYLYYIRGLYPTMFLYFLYALSSFAGYYIWKKKGVVYG